MLALDKLVTLGQTGTVSPHPRRCAFQNPGRLRKALWSHDIAELNLYQGRFSDDHVPPGLWGMTTNTRRLPCPLTELEGWARTKPGMPALPPEGFMRRYIRGVNCPPVGLAQQRSWWS
jgi:hypothetical protein